MSFEDACKPENLPAELMAEKGGDNINRITALERQLVEVMAERDELQANRDRLRQQLTSLQIRLKAYEDTLVMFGPLDLLKVEGAEETVSLPRQVSLGKLLDEYISFQAQVASLRQAIAEIAGPSNVCDRIKRRAVELMAQNRSADAGITSSSPD